LEIYTDAYWLGSLGPESRLCLLQRPVVPDLVSRAILFLVPSHPFSTHWKLECKRSSYAQVESPLAFVKGMVDPRGYASDCQMALKRRRCALCTATATAQKVSPDQGLCRYGHNANQYCNNVATEGKYFICFFLCFTNYICALRRRSTTTLTTLPPASTDDDDDDDNHERR